jgi:DNA-binding MarR family transcriptional regulator
VKKDDSLGLVYLLKTTELAVRGCAEVALAPFKLTPALFLMLFRIKQSDGVSSADLARTVGVRPQSIVDLIRPLERGGLIRRKQAREHRRILRIYLTAAGERLLDRAIPVARQLEEELFSSLTGPEIAHLREGLTKLLSSAQAHETHPAVKRAASGS